MPEPLTALAKSLAASHPMAVRLAGMLLEFLSIRPDMPKRCAVPGTNRPAASGFSGFLVFRIGRARKNAPLVQGLTSLRGQLQRGTMAPESPTNHDLMGTLL